MAWYRPVRFIVEPWIQFIRNIPPLAYVPLVVLSVGVGRTPQIIVICLSTFLVTILTFIFLSSLAMRSASFQNISVSFPPAYQSVKKNVEFGLKLKGISKDEIEETAMKYIRMVDLEKFTNA